MSAALLGMPETAVTAVASSPQHLSFATFDMADENFPNNTPLYFRRKKLSLQYCLKLS